MANDEKLTAEIEVVELTAEATMLEQQSTAIVVSDDASAGDATNLLSFIAGAKKKLEERRKFFVKPLNDQVKKVNDLFKEYNAPLDNADRTLRGKVLSYRQEVQRKQREEQERLRVLAAKEQARLEKKAEKKGEPVPVPIVVPVAPPQESTIKAAMGSATAKLIWHFDITDASQVPREYLVVDSMQIRAAVRDGIREIPGVNIYSEELLSVRANKGGF